MTTSPAASSARYAPLSIVLHWAMLVLIAGAYLTAELQEGGRAAGFATLHHGFGLAVLVLVGLRIVARLAWPAPASIEAGWRDHLSRITHGALYLLMIGMPVVGWMLVSAEGEPVRVLGVQLPPLVAGDRGLAEALEELHEIGGTLGYALIGLHAAAALFHQYVLRDGLMARMLPARAGGTR